LLCLVLKMAYDIDFTGKHQAAFLSSTSPVETGEAWCDIVEKNFLETFCKSLRKSLWTARRPARYDAEAWKHVMLAEESWPCSAPDMYISISLQGLARSSDYLAAALSSCASWARCNRLRDWMLRLVEEKFDFASSATAVLLKHLEGIFPVLREHGEAALQRLHTIQVELQSKRDRVQTQLLRTKQKLACHSKSVPWIVEATNRALISYRRTLLMMCKVGLEDWVFLLRKHLQPGKLRFEELMMCQTALCESSVKDTSKLVGLLLSPLLLLSWREAAAKLKKRGVSSFAGRIAIGWSLWSHSHSFEKPLLGILDMRKPRAAWRLSAD